MLAWGDNEFGGLGMALMADMVDTNVHMQVWSRTLSGTSPNKARQTLSQTSYVPHDPLSNSLASYSCCTANTIL